MITATRSKVVDIVDLRRTDEETAFPGT